MTMAVCVIGDIDATPDPFWVRYAAIRSLPLVQVQCHACNQEALNWRCDKHREASWNRSHVSVVRGEISSTTISSLLVTLAEIVPAKLEPSTFRREGDPSFVATRVVRRTGDADLDGVQRSRTMEVRSTWTCSDPTCDKTRYKGFSLEPDQRRVSIELGMTPHFWVFGPSEALTWWREITSKKICPSNILRDCRSASEMSLIEIEAMLT